MKFLSNEGPQEIGLLDPNNALSLQSKVSYSADFYIVQEEREEAMSSHPSHRKSGLHHTEIFPIAGKIRR